MDSDFNGIRIPEVLGVAIMVCNGLYGNGEARIANLKEEGYDPKKVQACVNEIFKYWG